VRTLFPSDINTTVLSVRVPNSIAADFDARCEALQTNRSAVLGGVVRLATTLGDGALRAAVKLVSVGGASAGARPKPTIADASHGKVPQTLVDAIDLAGHPGKFAPEVAARLNDPAYRRNELAYRARHRAALANNRMPTASDPVQVSYFSAAERTQYQAALAGRVKAPGGSGPPARAATAKSPVGVGVGTRATAPRRTAAPPQASKPAPAKRAAPPPAPVTRETLCLHLGLRARSYGGEIRRKAKNVASGLPGMGSSPAQAAALRAHLGLPATASDDRVNAVVWSLTEVPGGPVNPYVGRL
jgi:hypothetical protein